jgi:hypothetical protein
MTQTERAKIEAIIKHSKEGNPQAIKPIVNSLIANKISDLLKEKREQVKKEL